MLRLGFCGAAGTVTGSRFIVESDKTRVLIDCGMFQGLKQLRLLNWQPTPFDPRSLDAVILTHAHIDHSGYLPRLVKMGFSGPIYASHGTLEMAKILLRDAASLQEEDAEYANKKGYSKHHPAEPLFTLEDANRAIHHIESRQIGLDFDVKSFNVKLHNAGHILGSTFIELDTPVEDGQRSTTVFSGDLGRYDAEMHEDPAKLPKCDTLVLESTYGSEVHDVTSLEEQLKEPLQETIRHGGTVLIPAFAVARSQLVILLLSRLMNAGQLPRVPIHLDSPMAIEVSEAYARALPSNQLRITQAELFPKGVTFHRTREDSQKLNDLKGPRIIIAGSGMMTGGRVLHHMKRLLPEKKNLLVMVGYQAAGTRGRAILEGARFVRMHGGDVPVAAKVLNVTGLSSHADQQGIERWLSTAPARPKTIFLTHGEPPSAKALSDHLEALNYENIIVPELYEEFELPGSGYWQRQPMAKAHGARQ